jgi:hypothetical protein
MERNGEFFLFDNIKKDNVNMFAVYGYYLEHSDLKSMNVQTIVIRLSTISQETLVSYYYIDL